jgi:N-acetylmuramoyl-L-alanine amidase
VPRVVGAPLGIRVVSPAANASVGSRDSTFVFGQVGSGDATLTVNGAPVDVAPNGAFLAFLPVPPAGAPRYELVATRGAETARLTLPVRLPAGRRPLAATGPLRVDSASLSPSGRQLLRTDERVRVSVRAPRNASVWLVPARGAGLLILTSTADSARAAAEFESVVSRRPEERRALVDLGAARASDDVADAATTWARDVSAFELVGMAPAQLVVARGGDTVRLAVRGVETLDYRSPAAADERPSVVQLGRIMAVPDTDRVVVGRPVPGGTYRWFFLPGTVVQRTGGARRLHPRAPRRAARGVGGRRRRDRRSPRGTRCRARVAGAARVVPAADWVDLSSRSPTGRRTRCRARRRGGARAPRHRAHPGDPAPSAAPPPTRSCARCCGRRRRRTGADHAAAVARAVRLPRAVGARRARAAAAARPARGARAPARRADHRRRRRAPARRRDRADGAWEPVAVLPVAERVRALLEARGARVLMTRTTAAAVGPHRARRRRAPRRRARLRLGAPQRLPRRA